ncbi:CRP/FNR family cyclic AMP-dependent transcriptional regulator [Marmoricola sp. OAE513]|uniref:cyclic nucleotide-binding domain-containing protein n=1 Tax=Marmoricola sp. OAE513 TaxID=2817894 RepID=UPI001AE552C3
MRLHPQNKKIRMLRALPLFADCKTRELAEVAAIADEIQLPAGRVMARENAEGGEFIVIAEGTAEVTAEVQHGDQSIADLGPGDFFGEIALVTGRRRNATVVATSPVRALVIEGHAFLSLLEHSPRIRARVETAVAERLARAS